eukprot:gene6729-362_t
MGGNDVGVLRALSNHVNLAGFLRWSWKSYHHQPAVVAATVLGIAGCGVMYAASTSHNEEVEKYKKGTTTNV